MVMRVLLKLLAVGALAGPVWADYTAGNLHAVAHFDANQAGTLSFGNRDLIGAYSNVTNFLGAALSQGPSENQAGNQITRLLADDITPMPGFEGQAVQEIVFSVANLNDVPVSVRARVRFWLSDGAGGVPGTYYQSGSPPGAIGFTFNPFTFSPGVTVLTGTVAGSGFTLPSGTFWAGVTFDNNVGGTGATPAQMDLFGQGIFDPPDAGTSADLAFETDAAGSFFNVGNPAGSPFNFGGTPVANFGWAFNVPEPASATLLVLVALLVRRRRRVIREP
jgi:hypothetical protein